MSEVCKSENCLSCYINSGKLRQALEHFGTPTPIIEKIITRCG